MHHAGVSQDPFLTLHKFRQGHRGTENGSSPLSDPSPEVGRWVLHNLVAVEHLAFRVVLCRRYFELVLYAYFLLELS